MSHFQIERLGRTAARWMTKTSAAYTILKRLFWGLLATLLAAACAGTGTPTPVPIPTLNAQDPILVITDKASLISELGVSADDYEQIEDRAKAAGELHYFDEEYIATRSEAARTRLLEQQKAYRDATTKSDTDAIRDTRADYVSAVDGWLEGLLRAKRYYAVLIIGGDDVIPYPILDNPTSDPDPWIYSDDAYGDTDHDPDALIDHAVARIPDGGDKELVLAQLASGTVPPSAHYGLGNINRHGAEKVAAIYGGEADFQTCEPNSGVSFEENSRYTYFMLHGDSDDTTTWWGEEAQTGNVVDGLRVAQAKSDGLVTSAACYGAYTIHKTPSSSIALSFLKSGSWALTGSTGISYSGNYPDDPDVFLTLNSGRFYRLFFDRVTAGEEPLSAFYHTKLEYARDAKRDPERKIMHEYLYYGRPRPQPGTPTPGPPVPTPDVTAVPPTGSAASATILLLDVSGSMESPEPTGQEKMDAARDAAANILDMIETENQVQGAAHQVALVAFSTQASVRQSLTSDLDRVRTSLSALAPEQMTNMAQGIRLSNQELAQMDGKRLIFLLSDGVPTVNELGEAPYLTTGAAYANLQQEVLDGPVTEAASAGNCIYTIGFGDPNDCEILNDGTTLCSIDEAFLRDVAHRTGCGDYYPAADAQQLANIYVQLRHQALGDVVDQFSGQVAQGETTLPHPMTVPKGQQEMHASLNWPGSRLDLILTDPRGRNVDVNYPGVTMATFARMAYLIITDPLPGTWQAAIKGVDVPEGITDYSAVFSVRPAAVSGPAADNSVLIFAVVLVMIVGGGLIAGLVYRQGQPNAGRHLPVPVVGVQVVGQPGQVVGLRRGMLHIGRDPASELVLDDPRVSRHHARIVATAQGYLLEDLGSTNGTLVNGEQVTRRYLYPGDQICVGDVRLAFWVERGGQR